MKILFVVTQCDIFRINSGGANRNNMFVKALSEMGHVDVVSFNEEGLKSNIKNCDVIYSEIIHDKHHYVDSVVSWILMSLSPTNPYSYYKRDKNIETVIDGFVRRNNYDIIYCCPIKIGIDYYSFGTAFKQADLVLVSKSNPS